MASEYDPISVSMTVTVTMTPDQAQAYARDFGTGFVDMEIMGRLRSQGAEALQVLPWLYGYATVAISKPR
jgi:hypothetical protein